MSTKFKKNVYKWNNNKTNVIKSPFYLQEEKRIQIRRSQILRLYVHH